MGKVRYTVVLPSKIASILEVLSTEKGMTKAEVLRRALTIYDYLQRETENSSTAVYIRNKKNKKEKELILGH